MLLARPEAAWGRMSGKVGTGSRVRPYTGQGSALTPWVTWDHHQ